MKLAIQWRHTRITNKGSGGRGRGRGWSSRNNGKKCGHLCSTQIVYEQMYNTHMHAHVHLCVRAYVCACVFVHFHFPYDGTFWAKHRNKSRTVVLSVRGVAQRQAERGKVRGGVCLFVCVWIALRLKSGTRVLPLGIHHKNREAAAAVAVAVAAAKLAFCLSQLQ